MKNLKIYKRALAILTAATMVLLTGCMGDSSEETKKEETKPKACRHLTVTFEDQPITFKECEGYIVDSLTVYSKGCLLYSIYKDDELIIENGYTNQYNDYGVYHEVADEIIENESVQKAKIKIK